MMAIVLFLYSTRDTVRYDGHGERHTTTTYCVDDSLEGGCPLLLWTPEDIVVRKIHSADIIARVHMGQMPLI